MFVPRRLLVPYFSNYFLSLATTTTSHHEIGDRAGGQERITRIIMFTLCRLNLPPP